VIEFYDAVKAMIPEQLRPQLFTAKLSDTPIGSDFPYAVLWGSPGQPFSGDDPAMDSLGNARGSVEFRFKTTIAATSTGSLDLAIKGVRGALDGERPNVTGWHCEPLTLTNLMDIQPDRDVSVGGMHPFYLVDEYVLTAVRTD